MTLETRDCIICNTPGNKIFQQNVLKTIPVNYYQCPNCNAVYTQEFTWAEKAYSNALNSMDTGAMQRNLGLVSTITDILDYIYPNIDNKTITGLDFGGGHGIVTRMLRDKGFDFAWYDKFATNLMAKGYEYKTGDVDIVTSFEVFEHMSTPIEDIEWIYKRNPKMFIFSTLLFDETPPEKDWWYYGFEHGQHITFYTKKTLSYIAQKFNWNYISIDDNLHIFADKTINLEKQLKIYHNALKKKERSKKIASFFFKPVNHKSLVWHDFLEQRDKLR